MMAKFIEKAVFDECVKDITRRIDEIVSNHLPHLDDKIDSLTKCNAVEHTVITSAINEVRLYAILSVVLALLALGIKAGEIFKLLP